MKNVFGNRLAQWCLVIVLASGATFVSQALPAGHPEAQLTLFSDIGQGTNLIGSLAPNPVTFDSSSVKGEPEFPTFQYDLSQADGSSLGLQPQPLAKPAASLLNEPGLPPAPPSLPAKPVEKPAPQPLSNRIVEYHMNVELDADAKSLSGTQTLTWKNPGNLPVQELYFHLYPNAFNSKKTTFMRESGGKLREDKSSENSVGGMELSSMKTLDGEELLSRGEYVQPDDGNKDDRTLIKVTLPKPVGGGEKITLKSVFSVKLPAVFARMGYAGDFIMTGQWFPKIAVYEPKGVRGRSDEGWNLHQYHGNSEFYADFGIYDVRIKVPSNYTVAATGFPTKSPVDDGKTKTYSFYSDDVHDFAWAASPNFIYYEEPYATAQIPGVRIKLYLDPKHENLKTRYMTAAKKALARYSQWYGTYPYSTLSIVVPPADGNGAGGMEYPTLVTGWGAADDQPDLELERVIVHEIGHQFWYGMVASNEFEEAWLDEGFTSYAEDKLMELEYGVKPNLTVESSYITAPEALKQNSWSYAGHNQYAENVYTRAKLVLKSIEQQVGRDTMDRVMKTYFQRWKFKHPTTEDFQKVLEDVTKTSWRTFFDQYIYGGLMVDYAVTDIQSKKVVRDGQPMYENTVRIQKFGGTYNNVPIRFHFADGSQIDKTWDGIDADVLFKLNHTAPLDYAVVDSQHSIVLENKRINSFMKTNVDSKLSIRWNLGVVKLIETLFGWVAW
ncbi:M1 family metallopeptidase [Paenibacillus doosanensis]|uniref:M1 family metallopeptidase n=1 Tax=Paenibacillus doosanensis TaxID=1229154 RepID=UPI00217FC074|nr:M1 family metallopeptidase [Paenibacillus doosanensis]MCS7464570.1 M1 family metallopeptidase [Paenibacillus doosanensis]